MGGRGGGVSLNRPIVGGGGEGTRGWLILLNPPHGRLSNWTTLFYPSPLLTIGPRPALPSPHTHNQLGHLGAFSSLQYGALDLPRVHKTTYAPVIYTPLCIMFWRRGYTLLGEVGGGWALEFPSFLGPKWHSPIGSMPFHRAQKTREFQGPTPSNFPT
jgi:hypothetical protein